MTKSLMQIVLSAVFCLVGALFAKAEPIDVPLVNGDFNTIYAHGTSYRAWTLGYGHAYAVGYHVEVEGGNPEFWPVNPDTTFIDIPGWVSSGPAKIGMKQLADNNFCVFKNGHWGGGVHEFSAITQILSGTPVLANNTYTLSLIAAINEVNEGDVNMELWAGATQIPATNPDAIKVWDNTTWTSVSKQFVVSDEVPAGDLKVVIWLNSYAQIRVDNVVLTRESNVRAVEGTVRLNGYVGDNTSVGLKFEFQRLDGEGSLTRTAMLASDGTFVVDAVPPGLYNILVKSGGTLSAKLFAVEVSADPTNLGVIELKNADINGDDRVSFEDFSVLQNTYGRSGSISVPHVVDGALSPGEWMSLYADPAGDANGGDVDLVGWAAEVRDGIFYAAFVLNPEGPTVAEYNDFDGGKRIWLSMWFDVDPASNPITGVADGSNQFEPRAQDIMVELGTDDGTLEGSYGWHSLNFWGRDNSFDNLVPVDGTFAYSGHIVEFSCPVSAILAELPYTDNAVAADLWTVAARGAGHGFGGHYGGDITDLKPLYTAETQTSTLGANPLVPAAAATGGCGPVGIAMVVLLALAFPAMGLGASGRRGA